MKNKGSQKHKKGRKRPKYQRPWPEHPQTDSFIPNKKIQANRLEGTNAAIRRRKSTYRRKTNTYAKKKAFLQRGLDTLWILRNFVERHHTTKKNPAVAQGIITKSLSIEELMMIQCHQ